MPKAERRAQLLGIAREIVQSGGIGALTMSALAECSGASKPVVYEHFENSESVAIALLSEYFDTSTRFMISRIVNPATIDEYFDMLIDSLFDFYQDEIPMIRSITNGFSSSSEVNAFYLRRQEKVHDSYQDLLLQQGVSQEASRLAAYALMEMIASTVREFAGANSLSNRDTLKRMVKGMLHSLVPEGGARPVFPRPLLEAISKAGQVRLQPVGSAAKAPKKSGNA